MIKSFVAVILLLLLVPAGSAGAADSHQGIKIYSGYLHHFAADKRPFWRAFLTKHFPEQLVVEYDEPCSLEFKSPSPFSTQAVTQVPSSLPYKINFHGNAPAFNKFVINIYTDDEQEYTIRPEDEGRHTGLMDEHHLTDSYLIYLVLAQTKIDHIEIAQPSGGDNDDRYVLEKMTIREAK